MVTHRLRLWLPVVAWLALIFFLSSRSGDQLQYPGPDYLAHGIAYGVLGFLLARALNGGMTRRPTARLFVLTLLGCGLWAVSDELHQSFVPGRDSSSLDLLSDMTGSAIACVVFPFLRRLRPGAPAASRGGRSTDGGAPLPVAHARAPARLTLLTRQECPLCDEAKEVIDRVIGDYHVDLEIVDVDSRRDLVGRYGQEVPVLLVNDERAFQHRMEETRLRRRLHPWRRPIR